MYLSCLVGKEHRAVPSVTFAVGKIYLVACNMCGVP